jgi:PhzF family phenazine biosynthesis protein
MKIYQVDAFTSRLFAGNPAAVVPLDDWLPDELLQSIAAENNLSETAFFVKGGEDGADYHLRWFTPGLEIKLCGHATLASVHVLQNHLGHATDHVSFSTRYSGIVNATREGNTISLDFPARPHEKIEEPMDFLPALGRQPTEVYRSLYNLMCVFENKREVHEIEPDPMAIATFDAFGIIATAPGSGHDFVSRYFAPRAGVNEDPVTGSAHSSLAPYWAQRLGKNRLTAHQVSWRGGDMVCEVRGDRVDLIGAAVTYLEGEIHV